MSGWTCWENVAKLSISRPKKLVRDGHTARSKRFLLSTTLMGNNHAPPDLGGSVRDEMQCTREKKSRSYHQHVEARCWGTGDCWKVFQFNIYEAELETAGKLKWRKKPRARDMRKGWENVCNMNENTSAGAHLRTHRLVVVVAVFAPTDADERSEAWEEIPPPAKCWGRTNQKATGEKWNSKGEGEADRGFVSEE